MGSRRRTYVLYLKEGEKETRIAMVKADDSRQAAWTAAHFRGGLKRYLYVERLEASMETVGDQIYVVRRV